MAQSDPTNSSKQYHLAGTYNHIGNVQVEQGDLAGAIASYREAVAILERLVKSDPSNVNWQSNFVENYARLGDVYRRSNDPNAALAVLRQGQAIMARLVKLSPDNAAWKRVLAWLDQQIAALTK